MQKQGYQNLRECPFCGQPAKIESFRVFTAMCYYAKCRCCDAEINRPVPSKKEAVEAWNRRAHDGRLDFEGGDEDACGIGGEHEQDAVTVVHGKWLERQVEDVTEGAIDEVQIVAGD